ncbi:ATP-dependent DNA helicase DinG [Anaerobacillus sp. MEB173]|uniref:ATP-dependent DNA helicase DinG n=1 Tax=Anaerobacillus sp. MEB173 TaxID=3383345 RepID=UPI003F8E062C
MLKGRFVVMDLETTGNSPKNGDRIIQIGAVVIENGELTERFSTFIYPNRSIPLFIQQFTGINDEMVESAPTFEEAAPMLLRLLDNAYFVAHNVNFDLSFLDAELQNCGYEAFSGPSIDTVELSRLLLPSENSYKLGQLAEKLNVDHDRPHQADSDAEVTAQLLLYLFSKLNKLPLLTLQKLQPLLKKFHSDLDRIIENIIQTKLLMVNNDDVDYDIYRQLVLKKRSSIDKNEDTFDHDQFNASNHELLDGTGTLSEVMASYEIREGQQEMMKIINDALEANQHLLIEAGTGTGKTLAYLFPSVYYAKKYKEKVVISTHTIQLQEQLIERDIPILKKAVPFDFSTAILKGRNHYLCLRKFEYSLSNTYDDHYDDVLTKGQILIWLTETDTGDVEELNLPSGGMRLWHELKSDAKSCLGSKCPWFTRCFYHQARRRALEAELIITNHALLFTDLVVDHQLLPTYKYAVIDEAHHIEDVASDYLGLQSDYFAFAHSFNRLGTVDGHDLIAKLSEIAKTYSPKANDLFTKIDKESINCKIELDELFRMIHDYVVNQKTSNSEVGRVSYRYEAHKEKGKHWSAVMEATLRVNSQLKDIMRDMKKIAHLLHEAETEFTFVEKGYLSSFNSVMATMEEERSKLEQLLLQYDPEYVYWIEADAKGAKNAIYMYSKPIDVSDRLADEFFAKKHSVIMTSATLTVKDSFSYLIDRLGLIDFGPQTAIIKSPFTYDHQVQMMIPTTVPNIKDVAENEYVASITEHLYELAKTTDGRMLVLFTSYEMLRKTYYSLKDINNDQFVLIGQGINSGSRAKLTKSFKQYEQAILFGTSSFWEGVDIPGEDLTCLVIVRLPFSPPDNPIIEAKSERLKELGKSPFMELSLPQAIIRFKQGFGRLIRTRKDRGVIVVFDRRLTTTRYGKSFIKSLPPLNVIEKPLDELLIHLKQWL